METKICTRCKIEKPISEFHHKTGKYVQPNCKECKRKFHQEWWTKNREREHQKYLDHKIERHHGYHLREWFGMTREDYENILSNQKGGCAICGKTTPHANSYFRHFFVDHEHETGKIRGLLCDDCNLGIGRFRESSDVLRKAAEYLEGFNL